MADDEIAKSLGEEFSALLAKQGITLSELSRKSGISRQSLIFIKQGKVVPLVKNAVVIEKALSLDTGWFEKEYVEISKEGERNGID